jgi:hypothetical protein
MFISEYINRKYEKKYADDDPLNSQNQEHETPPEA